MTMTSKLRTRVLGLVIGLLLLGCTYRPARFADRPAVTEVADDAPISKPRRRELNWNWYLSDIYLRRSLLDALDPKRPDDAGDVNALDEVPRSSWFQPPGPELVLQEPPLVDEGPPAPPLQLVTDLPRANDYGICVVDARGVRYELRRDDASRPEMKTSAAVIASHLIRQFGLLAPETHVVFLAPSDFASHRSDVADGGLPDAVRRFLSKGPPSVDGRYRMSAARWPVGIDVGVSEAFDVRSDDPNDVIAHRNRRTLRSLKVLGAWLAISRINPRKTRDAYVGEPGRGHLRHYLVGLEDALGAGSVVRRSKREGPRTDLGGGTGFNLITLGLWPGSDSLPTQRRLLAIGNLSEDVSPGTFKASPTYAPISHFQPTDGYWAAKRMARIPLKQIVGAVHAARILDSSARLELVRLIVARRQRVVAYWYGRVTPVEVQRVHERIVVLRDEAVFRGVHAAGDVRYYVSVVDEDGDALTKPKLLSLTDAEFAVEVPAQLLRDRERDRLVLKLHAQVDGKRLPRACHVHLRPLTNAVRVIGIRH